MTWTVTREEYEGTNPNQSVSTCTNVIKERAIPPKLHVRAIIDIDNEQAELKDLIASLQKHVKSDGG